MSQRLLSTMKSNIGNNVQDTSSNLATLIQNWINDRYIEIQRRVNFISIARVDYSFSSVSGTEDYVLPDDFGKELTVLDKTNKKILSPIDLQEWVATHKEHIDNNSDLLQYVILNSPVKVQPASAGTVSVVSGSSSDTSQSVFIRGIVSGIEDYETLALNGLTTVTGSKSFQRILGVSKDADTTGAITVTRGADTLSVLARKQSESRYKILRAAGIPTGIFTIEITYIQKLLMLESANDYPLIDCSDVLEAGATSDAWRYKRQYGKASEWEFMFEKRLANLIWDKENQPNQVHMFKPNPYSRDTV